MLQISNITTGSAQALITRSGVYGSVTVMWKSGYPPGFIPDFLIPGNITPTAGECFHFAPLQEGMSGMIRFALPRG